MILKQFNSIYQRIATKYKHISLLCSTNQPRCCSTTVNSERKKHKFDGPGLGDFIAKDFPAEQIEFVDDGDRIPYLDSADLGQNRKGKRLKKLQRSEFKTLISVLHNKHLLRVYFQFSLKCTDAK